MDLRIIELAQRPDLLPLVAAWIYNEWWAGNPANSVETVARLLRGHLRSGEMPMTLIALQDGEPVGTCTLLEHDVDTEAWPDLSPWLAAVYVLPDRRSQGIGGRLVRTGVEAARQLGVERLYLGAGDRAGFYVQLGWDVIDRRQSRGEQTSVLSISTTMTTTN